MKGWKEMGLGLKVFLAVVGTFAAIFGGSFIFTHAAAMVTAASTMANILGAGIIVIMLAAAAALMVHIFKRIHKCSEECNEEGCSKE